MQKSNPLAIVALVLGIASIPSGGILGIPAVICGHLGIAKTRREENVAGFVPALIGTILGYVGIALGLIALVIGMFVYATVGNVDVARKERVDADLQAIGTQLRVYEMQNLKPPSTEQGLAALVERPTTEPQPRRWRQLFEREPLDPWGSKYVYAYDNGTIVLFSKGPDREVGGGDDIIYAGK